MEKVNNSIATKLCANSLKNHLKKNIFSARQNSTTKLCRELFNCENKPKIG